MNNTFRISGVLIPLLLISFAGVVHAASREQNRALISELKNLELEQLIEVEVSLDEAFDIFGAVLKRRAVKVASGDEQSATRAPAVTTVITAQDIEAMGARDLDEVLETVPGMHINRNYLSYSSQFSMRGAASDFQVLMMQNGVPIDTLYTGGRNYIWGGMPVSHIQRIEIIRGPGSAFYGADAFTGTINIITKTRQDIDGSEVGTRIGGNGDRDAWLLHGDRWGEIDVAAMIEVQRSDGYDPWSPADAQTAIDSALAPLGFPAASNAPGPLNLERRGLDARLDLSKGLWRLRLGYQQRDDVGLGYTVFQTQDPVATQDDQRLFADLTYQNPLFGDHLELTARLSHMDMRTRSDGDQHLLAPGTVLPVDCTSASAAFDSRCQSLPPQCAGPGGAFLPECRVSNTYPEGLIFNGLIAERQSRFDLSALYSGLSGHLIRGGLGYYHGDLYRIEHYVNVNPLTEQALPGGMYTDLSDSPYSFLPEETRDSYYLYLQDSWALNHDWELTTGLRYDRYSDFGGTLNPRLALVWQIERDLTAKLLYGRAFRAPSFIELYTRNNLAAQGNPDLEAERLDNLELALDWFPTANLHLAANLYAYRWDDRIQLIPNAAGTLVAANLGEQRARGFEIEARWKASPRLSLLGNYSYQHAEDGDGQPIGRVPRHDAYLRADWLIAPNWYLDSQVNIIGERVRDTGDPRPSLDGYTTVDLTLRYKDVHKGGWNAALGVRNLFDEEVYQPTFGPSPDSYGQPPIPGDQQERGRYWFAELRYRF